MFKLQNTILTMKKIKISVAALLIAGASLSFQSCLGSFALTNNVLDWNQNIGKKFVNELVFIAFWILPVYEVTSLADLLVLNSIEFWSGKNPMDEASVKVQETDNGTFIVACDSEGYTITDEQTGKVIRFAYEEETQTWSYVDGEGESFPFMTFVDDQYVKMITPEGDMRLVELSEQGVMAYQTGYALPECEMVLAAK